METVKKKKTKGGRPKKPVRRERVTGIRLTKAEEFIVRQKAAKAGMRLSAYIREMAIRGKVKARMTEEERHFVRQLIGMSTNLNQLAQRAHREGILKAMLHFEMYRNRLDELLKNLKNDQ